VYVFNIRPFSKDFHRKSSDYVNGLINSQKILFLISVLKNIGGGRGDLICGVFVVVVLVSI